MFREAVSLYSGLAMKSSKECNALHVEHIIVLSFGILDYAFPVLFSFNAK